MYCDNTLLFNGIDMWAPSDLQEIVFERSFGIYSGFPRIRNHFFGYSLLFLNNNLLFYPLFYMKIEICFLYKGVSYLREPAVIQLIRLKKVVLETGPEACLGNNTSKRQKREREKLRCHEALLLADSFIFTLSHCAKF